MVEQHVLRNQRLAVKFSSMNYWSNNNFCRCPVPGERQVRATAATDPPPLAWLRHWLRACTEHVMPWLHV